MKSPLIISVDPRSPAHRAGVRPGEHLVSINGRVIRDVLDFRFYSVGKKLALELADETGTVRTVRILKTDYAPLGLEFETYLMDEPRSCANNCIFCFIDQLPRDLRETLYFKDDDARLSFLMGNYITLTNLSEREIRRIIDLKISPINISVHTTNPTLRSFMLRNKKAAEGFSVMKRFAQAGIQMNCQIVCVPDVNDGHELIRSMEDLSTLYPAVSSVSVVPVGLTKHRNGLFSIRAFDHQLAGETIDAVDAFGARCLARFGSRVFFCGDELYLKAGRQLPPYAYYEDFPQFENGVGMLRSLEYEFLSALDGIDWAAVDPPSAFSLATGEAAVEMLKNLLQILQNRCYNIKSNVFGIRNDFFGQCVDVAGLVTGSDLIAQLKGKKLGSRLLIPSVMLRHGGDVFLDNTPLDRVSQVLGIPVIPVPNDGAQLLFSMLNRQSD